MTEKFFFSIFINTNSPRDVRTLGNKPPQGGFVIYGGTTILRTTVYIDGFNLYFGCLKNTPYKWLDLYTLFDKYLLDNTTTDLYIKYFTAQIRPSHSDDSQAPFRQQRYIEALLKYSPAQKFEVIYGQFPPPQKKYMRRAEPDSNYPPSSQDYQTVKVLVFEEKQSDVNIAVNIINDAWLDKFDQAVLCSNDTDLTGALAALKTYHKNKRVGVIHPIRNKPASNRRPSHSLITYADWHLPWIPPQHLAAAQLPDLIPNTTIKKPEKWKIT